MKTNHYTILLVIYINIYLESSVIAGWIYKMKKLFKNIIKQLYRYIYSKTILIKIGHSWKTTLRKSMKIMKKKQKPLQSDNFRTVIKKNINLPSIKKVSVVYLVCWHSWTADPRTRVGWRLTCHSLGIIRVLITSFLDAFGCEEWLMRPLRQMCFINTLR